jgi:hypothetical protein
MHREAMVELLHMTGKANRLVGNDGAVKVKPSIAQ